MRTLPVIGLVLALSAAATAQSVRPERWDVTSTVAELTIPGAPGFLLKMAKGRSRAEHKCVAPGAGIAALLVPDPKAKCRIDSQQIANGRYAQVLVCPQKKGAPMTIRRAGTYDANGFAGRAEANGQTPKGASRIVLDQRAARVAGTCPG